MWVIAGKNTVKPASQFVVDFLFVTFSSFALSLWSVRRGVDQNWDLQNYHHFSGWVAWTGRDLSLDTAPAGIQTYFHPWMSVISYLSSDALAFPLNKAPLLILQLLVIIPIVILSRQLAASVAPSLLNELLRYSALSLTFLSPLWLSELGTSFFTSSTSFLLIWSLVFVIWSLQNSGPKSILFAFLSGAITGLATALKLTNGPFSLALFFALLVGAIALKQARYFRNLGVLVAGGLVGFAIASGWYLKVWSEFQSPLFPLYNRVFRSPYYPEINVRDDRWQFESPVDVGTFLIASATGTQETSEVFFADPRYLILALLLLAAIFARGRLSSLDLAQKIFISYWIVGFILWATIFAYQRYAIPLELTIGLMIWIFLANLVGGSGKKLAIALGVTIVTLFSVQVPNWNHATPPSRPYLSSTFDLTLPPLLADSPATYIFLGKPITYIAPNLAPGSSFHALGTSETFDERIRQLIVEHPNDIPIRLITNELDQSKLEEQLNILGLGLSDIGAEDCEKIPSLAQTLLVCYLTD